MPEIRVTPLGECGACGRHVARAAPGGGLGTGPGGPGGGTVPELRSRTPRAAARAGSGPLWRERGGWLWGHVLATPPCPVFLTVR